MPERLPPEECEECGGSGWRDQDVAPGNRPYRELVVVRCECGGL